MRPELIELKELWKTVLGEPLPSDANFAIWSELHTPETIRHGIVKTGLKNLQLNNTMTPNHKIRFASKVMQTKTHDPQKIQGQRLQTGAPC